MEVTKVPQIHNGEAVLFIYEYIWIYVLNIYDLRIRYWGSSKLKECLY